MSKDAPASKKTFTQQEMLVEHIKQHPGPVQVTRRVHVMVPGKHFPALQTAEQAQKYKSTQPRVGGGPLSTSRAELDFLQDARLPCAQRLRSIRLLCVANIKTTAVKTYNRKTVSRKDEKRVQYLHLHLRCRLEVCTCTLGACGRATPTPTCLHLLNWDP